MLTRLMTHSHNSTSHEFGCRPGNTARKFKFSLEKNEWMNRPSFVPLMIPGTVREINPSDILVCKYCLLCGVCARYGALYDEDLALTLVLDPLNSEFSWEIRIQDNTRRRRLAGIYLGHAHGYSELWIPGVGKCGLVCFQGFIIQMDPFIARCQSGALLIKQEEFMIEYCALSIPFSLLRLGLKLFCSLQPNINWTLSRLRAI